MKQKSLALIATLLVLFFASSMGARPAFACGCGKTNTEAEAWAEADVVLTGKVTHVPKGWPNIPAISERGKPFVVKMDVQSVSKGHVGSTVTFRYSFSCTYPFRQGGTYRVYAHYAGDSLETAPCSNQTMIGHPDSELLAWGGLALALATASILYRRRRRRKASALDQINSAG
jgi:LPXTG-motif cell wall-anchored protein